MAEGQNTPPADPQPIAATPEVGAGPVTSDPAQGSIPTEAPAEDAPAEPNVTTQVVRRDPVGTGQDPIVGGLPTDIPEDKYRGPDWAGHPNFYCPAPGCGYATLDGAAVTEAHVRFAHPDLTEAP